MDHVFKTSPLVTEVPARELNSVNKTSVSDVPGLIFFVDLQPLVCVHPVKKFQGRRAGRGKVEQRGESKNAVRGLRGCGDGIDPPARLVLPRGGVADS